MTDTPSAYGTNSTADTIASRFQVVAPGPLAARVKTRAALRAMAAAMSDPVRLATLDARPAKRMRARKRG